MLYVLLERLVDPFVIRVIFVLISCTFPLNVFVFRSFVYFYEFIDHKSLYINFVLIP